MRIKMFFLFIIILFVVYITGAPHPEWMQRKCCQIKHAVTLCEYC